MIASKNAPRRGWRLLTSWLIIVTSMLATVQFFFVDLPLAQAGSANGYASLPYNDDVNDPTGEKPQSKLWYADGRWWGSLQEASSGKYYIYWLDASQQKWVQTSTVLDPRPNTKADCLWDAATNTLYVASGGSGTDGRLYRYAYNPGTKTYSSLGSPITIRTGGAETLVIDKDTTGQLWATYTKSGKVYVNHSIGANTAMWGTPYALTIQGMTETNLGGDDISSLVAFDGKIGLMWSNQNTDKFYFATHADNDPDTSWTAAVAYSKPNYNAADDHINLKSLQADAAGNVFAAVKTSIDGTTTTSEQLLVLARRADGSWRSAMVSSGQENLTRPILLIDTSQRKLYVFMTTEGGGSLYYKHASVDTLYFSPLEPFIGGKIGEVTYSSVNNATSTKQNVTTSSGIVVLASDDSKRMYLHNYLGNLTPPPITVTPTTDVPPTATTAPPPATATPIPTINPKIVKRVFIPVMRK